MSTALCLSGGFFKGAFQAGVIDVMYREAGVPSHDYLVGTSVGALIAGHLAMYHRDQGPIAARDLVSLFSNIRPEQVIKRWFPFGKLHALWKSSIYDSSPLRELIATRFDPARVLNSGRHISVGAVSWSTGESCVWNEHDIDALPDAIYASAAAPVAIELASIDGELYTDWGVREITPLRTAISLGEGDPVSHIDIIATWSPGVSAAAARKPNVLTRSLREIDILVDEVQRGDVATAEAWNTALHAGAPCDGKRVLDINLMRPKGSLEMDAQQPTPAQLHSAIEHGRRVAREHYFGNPSK